MKRGSPMRRTPLKIRTKSTGPAQDVVDAVYERASHSCEACSAAVGPVRGLDHHVHHRRPRAMGGTDRPDTNLPSNLLLLCPPCHADVESRRATALEHGHLLWQADDPAQVAVLIRRDRWRYLTVAGGYSVHPPKEAS
jgi:5-methylcytosine-specific restriction protein A